MDWLRVCGPDANFSFLTLTNVSQTLPCCFCSFFTFFYIYQVVLLFVLFCNLWLYKVTRFSLLRLLQTFRILQQVWMRIISVIYLLKCISYHNILSFFVSECVGQDVYYHRSNVSS